MDMKMPVLGGHATLHILKKLEIKHYPKVILISAYTNEEIQDKLANIQVTACITKPFDIDNLLEEIDRTLLTKPGE